jgi:hypothetical protein
LDNGLPIIDVHGLWFVKIWRFLYQAYGKDTNLYIGALAHLYLVWFAAFEKRDSVDTGWNTFCSGWTNALDALYGVVRSWMMTILLVRLAYYDTWVMEFYGTTRSMEDTQAQNVCFYLMDD